MLGKVQTDLALMKLDNKQMALDKKQKALDIQSLLARQDNFERKTTSRIREGLTSMKK